MGMMYQSCLSYIKLLNCLDLRSPWIGSQHSSVFLVAQSWEYWAWCVPISYGVAGLSHCRFVSLVKVSIHLSLKLIVIVASPTYLLNYTKVCLLLLLTPCKISGLKKKRTKEENAFEVNIKKIVRNTIKALCFIEKCKTVDTFSRLTEITFDKTPA